MNPSEDGSNKYFFQSNQDLPFEQIRARGEVQYPCIFGGKWAFEKDPVEAARKMIMHIDKKRQALKLKPMIYEQAFEPGA